MIKNFDSVELTMDEYHSIIASFSWLLSEVYGERILEELRGLMHKDLWKDFGITPKKFKIVDVHFTRTQTVKTKFVIPDDDDKDNHICDMEYIANEFGDDFSELAEVSDDWYVDSKVFVSHEGLSAEEAGMLAADLEAFNSDTFETDFD